MIRKYEELTADDIAILKEFVQTKYYPALKKHLDKRLKEMNTDLLSSKKIEIIDQMSSLQSFIYGIAHYNRPEPKKDDTE